MMERSELFIGGTARSPEIDFNRITGELILTGKSIPENAAKVYEPLLAWINDYIKKPRSVTNLRLNLEYYNSASVLWFAKIVKALSKISREDCILFIHIYIELDDFESINMEEIKDIVFSLIDNVSKVSVSIGLKIYGTDNNKKIVKESTILI